MSGVQFDDMDSEDDGSIGSIDFDMEDEDDDFDDEDDEDEEEEDSEDDMMDDDGEASSLAVTTLPPPSSGSSGPIIQASISGFGEGTPQEGGTSKVVFYAVFVQQKGAVWTIYRRYRQFHQLCDSLTRSSVSLDAVFPPKQVFGSTSEDFLQKRAQGLEKWLRSVCLTLSTLGNTPKSSVMNFLTHDANVKPKNFQVKVGKVMSPSSYRSSRSRHRCKVGVQDFEMIKMIGKGSFGEVMLVRKKDTKTLYAMKILDKKNIIRRNQVEHTITERRVLGRTKHPFIVTLHFAFQTGKKLYFVLDYCSGGELFFHLGRCGRLRESLACFYSAEITLALSHLHSVGIVYRDLKPENILLDKDGHVKLADFGLSKEGIPNGVSGTGSFCGTAEYLAPEILNRAGHGTGVDWWALGMVRCGVRAWSSSAKRENFNHSVHGFKFISLKSKEHHRLKHQHIRYCTKCSPECHLGTPRKEKFCSNVSVVQPWSFHHTSRNLPRTSFRVF